LRIFRISKLSSKATLIALKFRLYGLFFYIFPLSLVGVSGEELTSSIDVQVAFPLNMAYKI
jgi:hypothetical protein